MPNNENHRTLEVMKGVRFKTAYADEKNVTILVTRYTNNDRIAIQAMCPMMEYIPEGMDSVPMEPLATCTVNMIDAPCGEWEIYVKDYSENGGMVECLKKLEIIEDNPAAEWPAGYAIVKKFPLTAKFIALVKAQGTL